MFQQVYIKSMLNLAACCGQISVWESRASCYPVFSIDSTIQDFPKKCNRFRRFFCVFFKNSCAFLPVMIKLTYLQVQYGGFCA